MNPADLYSTVHLIHQAHQALARPCPCPNPRCRTMGDHLWRATADARPGTPAAALEPSRSSEPRLPLPERPTPTNTAHNELQALLVAVARAAAGILDLAAVWRPDRPTDPAETGTTDDWCTHHLELIGACEPVYRARLCRRCYDFGRVENILPPAGILNAWHRGERVTVAMVAEAKAAARAEAKRRKRRKKANAR